MLTISSSEVRKEWSSIMDSAIRTKPVFIKRTRDYMMLCNVDMVSELTSGTQFHADKYIEENGGITLSLRDIDIVSYGKDFESAKSELINNLVEYAEEYYQNFDSYFHSMNRKAHLPYVIKALTAKSQQELEDAVVCHDGKI